MAKKILIADDEPNIVMSLEFLMENAGYEVRVAGNGEETLKALVEFQPDLVLLDVMMPKRNGYEVLQAIRANVALQNIKIIMLSAKGRDVDVEKGLGLGADAYVTKPFATRDLVAKVKEMLGE
ncbi:MAG TPA: response regulator [Myxococcaceae bacterium]|nr:response regulator [Myxococcaceae bacterium]